MGFFKSFLDMDLVTQKGAAITVVAAPQRGCTNRAEQIMIFRNREIPRENAIGFSRLSVETQKSPAGFFARKQPLFGSKSSRPAVA
jgi:hypothetical protein